MISIVFPTHLCLVSAMQNRKFVGKPRVCHCVALAQDTRYSRAVALRHVVASTVSYSLTLARFWELAGLLRQPPSPIKARERVDRHACSGVNRRVRAYAAAPARGTLGALVIYNRMLLVRCPRVLRRLCVPRDGGFVTIGWLTRGTFRAAALTLLDCDHNVRCGHCSRNLSSCYPLQILYLGGPDLGDVGHAHR